MYIFTCKHLLFIYICVCVVGMQVCAYNSVPVEVREQPVGVDFLLLPYGFWSVKFKSSGLNSKHCTHQAMLSAIPWPPFNQALYFLKQCLLPSPSGIINLASLDRLTRNCLPPLFWFWIYRHTWTHLCLACYVGIGDAHSGSDACVAGPSLTESSLQSPKSCFFYHLK